MSDPGPTRPMAASQCGDTRGVTAVLRYAVLLALVALLVTGLFVGVGELVEGQQERAILSQLETVGNRVAADLTTAGRLADTGEADTEVTVQRELPEVIAGSRYLIEINRTGSQRYELTLRSVEPELRTTVTLRAIVPIEETTVNGGRLRLVYDSAQGRVEVEDVE